MRLTITNDDGEVYAATTNVRQVTNGPARGMWVAEDDEGETAWINDMLAQAAKWEEANR